MTAPETTPDRADEKARELRSRNWCRCTADEQFDPRCDSECCAAQEDAIAAALRQAQGDIEGEVCPHWTPGLAKLVSDAVWMARRNMSRRDFDALGAVKDELDTLIQQADAKGGG